MLSIISISNGPYFPKVAIYGGYVAILIGMLSLAESSLLGFVFILIGIYLSFTYHGIDIEIASDKYRNYVSYIGIKVASAWKSLNPYSDLCILKTRESSARYSMSNQSNTSSESYFDIFLLNSSHRKKIFVERFSDLESAKEKAMMLANESNKKYTKYNPKGSIRH